MTTSSLDTQAHLQDIRLRVLNHERVGPEEMRDLLMDLRRDREATAKAAASARRVAKKAEKPAVAAQTKFSLDSLFPSTS